MADINKTESKEQEVDKKVNEDKCRLMILPLNSIWHLVT